MAQYFPASLKPLFVTLLSLLDFFIHNNRIYPPFFFQIVDYFKSCLKSLHGFSVVLLFIIYRDAYNTWILSFIMHRVAYDVIIYNVLGHLWRKSV